MINHGRRQSLLSRQTALYLAAAVALFCRVGRPEAWWGVPSEGSNPSSAFFYSGIGQSAARQSHKLKVAGSSPAPAPSFHAGYRGAGPREVLLCLGMAGVIFYFFLFCCAIS
jgi:hypothetical protein